MKKNNTNLSYAQYYTNNVNEIHAIFYISHKTIFKHSVKDFHL